MRGTGVAGRGDGPRPYESRVGVVRVTIRAMTIQPGTRPLHGPRAAAPADPHLAAELRLMALHLETASVLDLKARRSTDPAQIAVLRRRAEQRRREAARIRANLAARGVALGAPARRAHP